MSLSHPKSWKIPEITEAERRWLLTLTAELEQQLQTVTTRFSQTAFAPSFAVEDMVITDAICRLKLLLRIITLDTGKLSPETKALIVATEVRYQTRPEVFTPDKEAAAVSEREFGVTAMYDSMELRRRCCHIHKIEPLDHALKNAPTWLTGQRRSQSDIHGELNFEELDRSHNISKFNPIFDWEKSGVWAYAEAYSVPLNELYHQGCPSIGCEPYTRPVKEGGNVRAGCWWQKNENSKECSLHK